MAGSRLARALVSTITALVLGLVNPAHAATPIDCPLHAQSYSLDSPIVDVLLKPEAVAVLNREAPTLLRSLPARMTNTNTPTFAAILSLRIMAASLPRQDIERINRALAALPVTAADQLARCARYDIDRPSFAFPQGKVRLLLFEKMTGFRDGPSVEAARAAFRDMAARNGWAIVITDKGGAITPSILRNFDAIIWNNISGDVLTLTQRRALQSYVEKGGGFVAVHGSGGDPTYWWDWYVDRLIGARFLSHPMNPQFQDARVVIVDANGALGRDIAPGWTMKDEWYSFKTNPRAGGAHVIATLDESTYQPGNLAMGDHPIAWTNCIGNGRSFYSAIGHRPETYSDPHYVKLLERAIVWASDNGETRCQAGKEVVEEGIRVTQDQSAYGGK